MEEKLTHSTKHRGEKTDKMAYNPEFSPVTSSELYAANQIIGTDCKNENRAFLLCKSLDRNPETCLEPGNQVTKCVMSTYVLSILPSDASATQKHAPSNSLYNFILNRFDKVNKTAKPEFEAFRDCLANNENKFSACKAEQSAFHAAMGRA